jgi:hypothetical protein
MLPPLKLPVLSPLAGAENWVQLVPPLLLT